MMTSQARFFFATAILAAITFFAQGAMAQGAATATGSVTYQDICVTDPNAKLTPSVKPRKKLASINRSEPVKARAKKLATARKKKPVDKTPVADICPPGQKPMRVSFVTPVAPPQPVMSLCQSALGKSASVTSAQASGMLTQAGLSSSMMNDGMINLSDADDKDALAAAVAAAIKANPDAAPAILAYAVRNIPSQDTATLQAVTKAAYAAAPGQAAGLTYAAVSTNPSQTLAITQAMLGAASQADDSVIRQCAIDANPDLANDIATAAFVPALAAESPIGQNDIRNTIRNPSGTTTLVPGLETREKDDSGA
jgi:hypothetical protein